MSIYILTIKEKSLYLVFVLLLIPHHLNEIPMRRQEKEMYLMTHIIHQGLCDSIIAYRN